jgi:hypothetical protein
MSAALAQEAAHHISLPPDNPAAWTLHRHEELFATSWKDYEALQLAALQHRFAQLKDKVDALGRLVNRQGVSTTGSIRATRSPSSRRATSRS